MGRGGSFILGQDRGCHLRIVAPIQKRIENLVKYKNMASEDARRVVEASDIQRKKYIRRLFDADIDNPEHYDMVLNSAFIDVEEMIEVAAKAIEGKCAKLRHLEND